MDLRVCGDDCDGVDPTCECYWARHPHSGRSRTGARGSASRIYRPSEAAAAAVFDLLVGAAIYRRVWLKELILCGCHIRSCDCLSVDPDKRSVTVDTRTFNVLSIHTMGDPSQFPDQRSLLGGLGCTRQTPSKYRESAQIAEAALLDASAATADARSQKAESRARVEHSDEQNRLLSQRVAEMTAKLEKEKVKGAEAARGVAERDRQTALASADTARAAKTAAEAHAHAAAVSAQTAEGTQEQLLAELVAARSATVWAEHQRDQALRALAKEQEQSTEAGWRRRLAAAGGHVQQAARNEQSFTRERDSMKNVVGGDPGLAGLLQATAGPAADSAAIGPVTKRQAGLATANQGRANFQLTSLIEQTSQRMHTTADSLTHLTHGAGSRTETAMDRTGTGRPRSSRHKNKKDFAADFREHVAAWIRKREKELGEDALWIIWNDDFFVSQPSCIFPSVLPRF